MVSWATVLSAGLTGASEVEGIFHSPLWRPQPERFDGFDDRLRI
jgi:hypothetical protein